MKVKKLFYKILLACLPILSVMAITNYVVDPALVIRNSNYEEHVAQGILNDYIVAINVNYNDRKLQRALISNSENTYDSIIVGSSRIMSIPGEAFGEKNSFCNGVSGATIEDIISIIGMYSSRGKLPSTVFIGIDPWLFNENHGDTHHLEFIYEYNEFAESIGLESISGTPFFIEAFHKIEQLFSPTYFQASLKKIGMSPFTLISVMVNLEESTPKPILSHSLSNDCLNKLPDGSIVYDENTRTRTEYDVNRTVLSVIDSGELFHSENYAMLSPIIMKKFSNLIDFLDNCDVKTVFVIPPLHPNLYKYITESQKYAMLISAEQYVLDFAKQHGITVIGSINPEKVGAGNDDFYDYMHPTREYMTALCNSFNNS